MNDSPTTLPWRFARSAVSLGLMLPLGLPLGLPVSATPVSPRGYHSPGYYSGMSPLQVDLVSLTDRLGYRVKHSLAARGIDWEPIKERFKARAKALRTDAQLVDACLELLAEVGDSQAKITGLTEPILAILASSNAKTNGRPGLRLLSVKRRWYVRRADSEALAAGVCAGWEVETVDGLPVSDWMKAAGLPLAPECLRHPSGPAHSIGFRDSKRRKKVVRLNWRASEDLAEISGPVVALPGIQPSGEGLAYGSPFDGIGYVQISKLTERTPSALKRSLLGIENDTGLVLDLRGCVGAAENVEALLQCFDCGENGAPGAGSMDPATFQGQIVVIVDADTRGTAELLAGELKERRRAYLIGPAGTHGSVGSLESFTVRSGKFSVRYLAEPRGTHLNEGRGVEGIGIEPHVTVPYTRQLAAAGIDPCIQRARKRLGSRLPRKHVTYAPGR